MHRTSIAPSLLTPWALILVLASIAQADPKPGTPVAAEPKLAFVAGAQPGEFLFNTGMLKGSMHRDGKASGVQNVVYVPTNNPVSEGNGWFTHYRVITADLRYPKAAWQWTTAARLLPDGAVEIRWEPNEERPFEMTATYRWTAPDTLDHVTTVKAQKDLRKFEVFFPSYYSVKGFTSSSAWVKSNPQAGGKPGFMEATKAMGDLMSYPRDEEGLKILTDGRWRQKEHIIAWKILPFYAGALARRRDAATGLCGLMMAQPKDCFAIGTYYDEEKWHRVIYLSIFGRDIKSGQSDQARTRLVFGQNISDEQAIQRYRDYVKGTAR